MKYIKYIIAAVLGIFGLAVLWKLKNVILVGLILIVLSVVSLTGWWLYTDSQHREHMEKMKMDERIHSVTSSNATYLTRMEMDSKVNMQTDLEIFQKQVADKKEVLSHQLDEAKEAFAYRMREMTQQHVQDKELLQATIDQLRRSQQEYFNTLAVLQIDIETVNGVIRDVYWVKNGVIGVEYKYKNCVGGGVVSYSNLTEKSIRMFGLMQDINTRITTETEVKHRIDSQIALYNQSRQNAYSHR